MAESQTRIRAVDTSFDIIEELSKRELVGVSELAKIVDRPVSTVHNHLTTLADNGYVVQEGEKYRISYRFLEHGGRLRSKSELFREGRAEADTLADETGELVNLMVEENGLGTHIYLSKGEDAITFDTYAGKQGYLHPSALGKAILSEFGDAKVHEIIETHGLPEFTHSTATTEEELFEQLSIVRETGYALDDEERLEGLRCCAAPITHRQKGVVGAISISGPASRIKGDVFKQKLPEQVVRTADVIGINITYP